MRSIALLAALALGCQPAGFADIDSLDDDDDGSSIDDVIDNVDLPTNLASAINIEKISLYQGVEVILAEDGEAVDGNRAKPLANRPGLLRVFVDREDDFDDRDIQAVLKLEGDGEDKVYIEEIDVEADSVNAGLGTTFNFYLDAEDLKTDTEFSVGLYEVDDDDYDGGTSGTQFPEDGGMADMNVDHTDDVEIVLIPIKYLADGSGRLPDTSQAQVDRYRNLAMGMFPHSSVTVTVDQPLNWNQVIQGNGTGWNSLLGRISQMRTVANVDANTYYYGVFAPTSSLGSFCGAGGCVLGLSLLGGANDEWSRASIGIGYTGQMSAETLVHEVGHAQGREHAPCGTSGDPYYPYPGAIIGSWGFDVVGERLYDPQRGFRDIMSYCSPYWISDYNYNLLHIRTKALKAQGRVWGDAGEYKMLSVDGDGRVELIEGTVPMKTVPSGREIPVDLVLDSGSEVESVGFFAEYSHLPGGMLFVPADADMDIVDAYVLDAL